MTRVQSIWWQNHEIFSLMNRRPFSISLQLTYFPIHTPLFLLVYSSIHTSWADVGFTSVANVWVEAVISWYEMNNASCVAYKQFRHIKMSFKYLMQSNALRSQWKCFTFPCGHLRRPIWFAQTNRHWMYQQQLFAVRKSHEKNAPHKIKLL